MVSGISVLGAEYIIPFKMYAWLDLRARKSRGEHVNEKDLKKHKNDVFRLLPIINDENKIPTEGLVKQSIQEFLEAIKDENIRVEQLGIELSMDEVLDIYKQIYL